MYIWLFPYLITLWFVVGMGICSFIPTSTLLFSLAWGSPFILIPLPWLIDAVASYQLAKYEDRIISGKSDEEKRNEVNFIYATIGGFHLLIGAFMFFVFFRGFTNIVLLFPNLALKAGFAWKASFTLAVVWSVAHTVLACQFKVLESGRGYYQRDCEIAKRRAEKNNVATTDGQRANQKQK
jgi:hypothetical protein